MVRLVDGAGAGRPRPRKAPSLGASTTSRGRAEELINVAARMFFKNGYDATSLQDVADEMGMLKGSLYYYIKSKDDLLYAVVLRQHEAALALATACQESGEGPREQLMLFIDGYRRSLEEERIFVSVYLRDLDRLSAARRKKVVQERKSYVDFVVGVLEDGQRAGVFHDGLRARLAAQAILGMLNSSYRWYREQDGFTPADIVAEFRTLILQGLLVEPDSRDVRAS